MDYELILMQLRGIQAGQRVMYHKGALAPECDDGLESKQSVNEELKLIRRSAWKLYEDHKAILYTVLVGVDANDFGIFEYYARGVDKPIHRKLADGNYFRAAVNTTKGRRVR